jgi:hypothetical protein
MANRMFLDLTDAINNKSVVSGANIDEAKVMHRHHATLRLKAGTDVVAQTEHIFCAYTGCEVLAVRAIADTVPSGGGVDKKVTIDVKKSTGGGAFSSILTGTFDIDSADTSKTAVTGTLDGTPTLVAGDLLEAVVTVSGSVGTQAQGLLVEVIIAENGA